MTDSEIEIKLKVDPKNPRHQAAVVLFKEIEKLERAHNVLDAKLAAVLKLLEFPISCEDCWTGSYVNVADLIEVLSD